MSRIAQTDDNWWEIAEFPADGGHKRSWSVIGRASAVDQYGSAEANAAFCAIARRALPRLIAALKEARANPRSLCRSTISRNWRFASSLSSRKRLIANLRAVLEQRKAHNFGAACEALYNSIYVQTALKEKTDAEIADLLGEHILGDMNIFSPQSDLVSEAIERLRRGGKT